MDNMVILKNGTKVSLRSAQISDAAKLIEYMKIVVAETDFLNFGDGDFNFTLEMESEFLKTKNGTSGDLLLIALDGDKIIGSASVDGMKMFNKTSHRAVFGIASLKEYHGLGLGTALINGCIDFGKKQGYMQLELEVVTKNISGIRLYEKAGFKKIGTRPNAFKLADGTIFDMDIMVKDLRG